MSSVMRPAACTSLSQKTSKGLSASVLVATSFTTSNTESKAAAKGIMTKHFMAQALDELDKIPSAAILPIAHYLEQLGRLACLLTTHLDPFLSVGNPRVLLCAV